MFPILYKKDETNFTHNGLGVLSGAVSSVPEEEMNSLYIIKIEYDSDGFLADKIENGMIIKAKANDKQDLQLFRIRSITKRLDTDNYLIEANHITYDLAGNFVEVLAVSNVTLKEAMESIQKNLSYPTRFNITSSNNTTKSSTRLYRTNPLQMIGGMEGSILQIWGGQIERDNFNLIMHAKRGSDDGVQVTYRKNLTGLEAKFDESEVITRIFPFKYIEATEDEPEQLITIDGKFIDSPNIDKYPVIHIQPLDLSDDESIKNATDLYNASKDFFNTGAKDLPTVSMEIEFESLWDTEEYKDVAALELVGMGDTITVKHSKMGVDVKAQVVKVEYDSIAEKNKKVSVGNVKARLTDAVNKSTDLVNNIGEKINHANEKANEAIRAANGKNTNYYGPDEPTGDHLIEGDLWFRVVDGEYTRTYRYDGIEWQLVVSADIRDIEEEAQDARNKADEAVAKADLATGNANEAIEEAQKAFDEATNAHSAADAAKEAGEIAERVAKEAGEQAGTALENAQNALDGLKDKISSGEYEEKISDIEDKASDLRQKVSNAEKSLTEHGGKINTIEHDVNEMDGTIKTTINRISDMDDVLTDHTLTIEKNAKAIEAKAEATIVDNINKTVEDHTAEISLQAEAIAGKLESTVYEKDKTGIINSIEQNKLDIEATSEGLSLAVRKIDNMQIGGRNLASLKNITTPGLHKRDGYKFTIRDTEGTTSNYKGLYVSESVFKPHTKYVMSFKIKKLSGNINTVAGHLNLSPLELRGKVFRDGILVSENWSTGDPSYPNDNEEHQFEVHFTTGAMDRPADNYNLYIQPNRPKYGEVYSIEIWDLQVEEGDKKTGWQIPQEDTEEEISTLKTELELQAGLIESKISKDDFNILKGTVDSHTTKITQTEKDIRSKASQDSVNTITKDVEHHESLISQNAEAIKSKMSTTDANAKFATQSELSQTSTSLTSEIAKVQTNLDDLEIGGKNLLKESRIIIPSSNNSSNYPIGRTKMEELGREFYRIYRTRPELSPRTFSIYNTISPTDIIQELKGKVLTFSFRARASHAVTSNLMFYFQGPDVTAYYPAGDKPRFELTTSWKTYSWTVTFENSIEDYSTFRFSPQEITIPSGETENFYLDLCEFQIEEGTKASSWGVAEEELVTDVQFSKLEQNVDSISGQITKKLDSDIYDSFVQQTEKSLSSKISQGVYDNNNKLIDERFSSVTQTVEGVQTQVDDNKGNISSVTQLANGLQTRMSSAEGNISSLTQTSSSLQSTITSVKNNLEGMGNSGANLLPDGSFENGAFGWDTSNSRASVVKSDSKTGSYCLSFAAGSPAITIRMINTIPVVPGNKYEVSYWYKTSAGANGASGNQKLRLGRGDDNSLLASFGWDGAQTTWKKYTNVWTAPSDVKEVQVSIAANNSAGWVRWDDVSIVDVTEREETQSQISQISNAVNIRVKENDVINQINVDTSGVLIQGKKLTLDGNVNVTGSFRVNNAHITSVDAGKMTTGTLDAGKVSVINLSANSITSGRVNANNVIVSATNGNAKVELDSTGLLAVDSSGRDRIHLGIRNLAGKGQSDPSTLRFFSGNGSVSAGIGMNVNDDFIIGSQSDKVSTSIYSGKNQLYWANQHRFVFNDGPDTNYWIMRTVVDGDGDYHPGLFPTRSGAGYLGGNNNNRLWRIYSNYIHYVDLVNLSSRDSKSNIEDANLKEMQAAFDEMDLVTFNYKNEDGSARSDELKIGWIAEDSPDLITSKDKKQISHNNTVGVIAGTLKNQISRVDQLEDIIEQLVLKIAKLEAS